MSQFICHLCHKPYKSYQGTINGPYCECMKEILATYTGDTSVTISYSDERNLQDLLEKEQAKVKLLRESIVKVLYKQPDRECFSELSQALAVTWPTEKTND